MILINLVNGFKTLGVDEIEFDKTEEITEYLKSISLSKAMLKRYESNVINTKPLVKDRFLLFYPERFTSRLSIEKIIDVYMKVMNLDNNFLGIYTSNRTLFNTFVDLTEDGVHCYESSSMFTDGELTRILYYLYEEPLFKGFHYPHLD
jgi:hypothetical protein